MYICEWKARLTPPLDPPGLSPLPEDPDHEPDTNVKETKPPPAAAAKQRTRHVAISGESVKQSVLQEADFTEYHKDPE